MTSGTAGFSKAIRSLVFGDSDDRDAPSSLILVPPNPWPGDATRGRAMIGNAISLAGETIVPDSSAWDVQASEPWRAALHSFEWLRDLRAVGGDSARRHARALTNEWLDRYQRRGDFAWRPDLMGARLANWIGFHDFFCASADDEFRARLFAAMARQARALSRALPGDLAGAPLLLAIKGLLACGLCLGGGEAWFTQAEKSLLRELPRQILADGCHAERSPMVHATVLAALIDIRALYKAAKIELPEALQHAIDRMTPALRFFRHGDGGLALFNGSQEGEALLVDTILTQADARGRPLKRASQAGFDRMSAGRTMVIVDTGAPAAPGLDRRAHAGIASFEMSIGRTRFIVNCGAHPGVGPWRAALAGTAAHSTLAVAGVNQIELLENGCGRRPKNVQSEREDSPEGALIAATHDSYAPLGLIHQRRLFLGEGGADLRGEDAIVGTTAHPFAIRFHLHPDVQTSLIQNGRAALLRLGDGAGWRFRSDAASVSLEESVYFGSGETPRRTSALVISGRSGGEDSVVRWAFRREKRAAQPAKEEA